MTNTDIPHLPNEILYEIVSYIADEDILNIRSSAKIFQSITADRFAVTFFETRAYDMSIQGLEALVKITEQPLLARHIRTIVIGHGGKVYPGEHYNLLVRAFHHLAIIGNAISLGLRQVRKCRNYRRRHHIVLRHTIEFFRVKVLSAAVHARMHLEDLVADLQSASHNRRFPSVSDSWVASFTREFPTCAVGRVQFNALRVKLRSIGSDSSNLGHVLISNRGERLEVLRADLWELYYGLPYLYRHTLREIVLEDCSIDSYCLLRLLEVSGQILQRLSMYNVRLKASEVYGLSGTWVFLFSIPKIDLRVLKSCKLGNLWDDANGRWLEGGDSTIEASNRGQVSTVLSNLAADIRTFTLDG
jgi:hypothetical protein